MCVHTWHIHIPFLSYAAFDGSGWLQEAANENESERRVVETLLSGTLLDPRFKATCFEDTTAHKAVAIGALRNMLERERDNHNQQVLEPDREMDEYLEEDIIAQVNDPLRVLEFWKANALRWPSLYRLATQLLAVPATRSPWQRALSEVLLDGDKESSVRNEGLDRVMAFSWDWLHTEADNDEADVEFSEAKRFALKCNLALLDHAQLFAA